MKIGIVGKPNSGKSTFFKASTLVDAKIGNFPFTTIDPNIGVGFVRVECIEKFFDVKCNPNQGYCVEGNRFVPVELIDIAGLVPDAYKGKGMGNQFLDNIRQANALIHIVDASGTTDKEGKECSSHNPIEDIEFLENELNRWFFSILEKNWKKINDKKDIEAQLSGLNVSLEEVQKVIENLNLKEDPQKWSEEKKFEFSKKLREEVQPILVAANKVDKEESKKWVNKLVERGAIPCSAEAELALKKASKKEFIKYLPGDKGFEVVGNLNEKQKKALEKIKNLLNNHKSTGLQEIINKIVFDILNYIVVYPVSKNLKDKEGRILPDAYLMPAGSTTLDLAYKIHKDFGDNFISGINVKTKQRLGKNYELKNDDVIEILHK